MLVLLNYGFLVVFENLYKLTGFTKPKGILWELADPPLKDKQICIPKGSTYHCAKHKTSVQISSN